jgi:hypothetical protein
MTREKYMVEQKIKLLLSRIKMEDMKNFEISPQGTPENEGKKQAISMVLEKLTDSDFDVIIEAIKQSLTIEMLNVGKLEKKDSPEVALLNGRIKAWFSVLEIIGEVTKKP